MDFYNPEQIQLSIRDDYCCNGLTDLGFMLLKSSKWVRIWVCVDAEKTLETDLAMCLWVMNLGGLWKEELVEGAWVGEGESRERFEF